MNTVDRPDLSGKSKISPFRMVGPIGALILILTGSLVGATPSTEVPSFFETCRTLQKLSKDAKGNREDWLRVIHSFSSIHDKSKDRFLANRSLFLAGKASLDLYRRSGKTEDLDEAIHHLSLFSNLNRKGPNLILGLRELKEAYSLKRKMSDLLARRAEDSQRRAVKPSLGSPPDNQVEPVRTIGNCYKTPDPSVPAGTGPPRAAAANTLPVPTPKATARESTFPVKSASILHPTINDFSREQKVANPSARQFVVAIDPGHGGKDPGAMSVDGRLKEKDLTLKIATMIKTSLESKNPPLKVVLTRSDDRYLSLEDRIDLANSANADLFISIHCNSATDSSSKGVETYYFSKANSLRAMKAAARENGIPLSKMSDVEATLIDLMVTSKKNESAKLAISVHSSLSQREESARTAARDRGVRQAPFYVLLGAKMPAILVECAFISNKRERGRLTSTAYLASIADKIADGAANYVKGLDSRG